MVVDWFLQAAAEPSRHHPLQPKLVSSDTTATDGLNVALMPGELSLGGEKVAAQRLWDAALQQVLSWHQQRAQPWRLCSNYP